MTLSTDLKHKNMITYDKAHFPFLQDEYDAYYIVSTTMLKMITDWPDSRVDDIISDIQAIFQGFDDASRVRTFNQTTMDAFRQIPESELDKLNPWQRRYIELLKLEWKQRGYEPDPDRRREDYQNQMSNNWTYHSALTNPYFALAYYDNKFSGLSVRISDRHKLRHAPLHSLRKLAQEAGSDPEKGPWIVSANSSAMFELFKYSSGREEKRVLWNSWVGRASFAAEDIHSNNSCNMEKLRLDYQHLARYQGYKSPADHILSTKMIGNAETCRDFIASLYHRLRPVLIQRYEDWRKYAEEVEEQSFTQIYPFDLFYICRQEAFHCYGVNPMELMNHFPVWQTFNNMVTLASEMFGLEFEDVTETFSLELGHPSARVFKVTDRQTNEHLGRLYVDPIMHEGKVTANWYSHLWRTSNESRGWDKLVWMVGAGARSDPETGRPGVIHHEELGEMLFAFGRALQLLLSRSLDYKTMTPHRTFANEWDADNILPEFMRCFIYKPALLKALSSPNVKTGEPLSLQEAEDAALALARSIFWDTWRTLFWSDFELSLYEMEEFLDKFWYDLYKEMYQEYFPFQLEEQNYQPCSFIPIFFPYVQICSYYKRLWCETLAMEIHETFRKEDNPRATSDRLKTTWLNHGNLKSHWQMYIDFQGREPNFDAIGNLHDPASNRMIEENPTVNIKKVAVN